MRTELTMRNTIDQFISAHDWSRETRDKYRRAVNLLLAEADPQTLTADSLKDWIKSKPWGSSQQSVVLYACKAFIRWQHGELHPALTAKIKRRKSPPQRSLTAAQIEDILATFNTRTPKGRRDLAMCALMVDTGLRVSEVARLELRYLDLTECKLSVIVKGGEWDGAIFSAWTGAFLAAWLGDREKIARPGVKTVFVGTHAQKGRPMTREGIQTIVNKWGTVAEVGKLSPHDFRRTFATLATRNGAPPRVLMEAGRWKTQEMITVYTRAITQDDFKPYLPIKKIMTGD